VPAFLRTHPVTSERIADSRNRADQYHIAPKADSVNYRLVKAKLRVLTANDPQNLLSQIESELKRGSYGDQVAERYAYALALTRTRHYDQARRQLQALLAKDPGRIAYLLALARVEADANHPATARKVYRDGLKNYPDNELLTMAYGGFLIDQHHPREAADQLESLTRLATVPPHAYELLAQARSDSGDKAGSHIALADYYEALGEVPAAIEQLRVAKRIPNLGFYHQSLIEAKLARLKEEAPAPEKKKDAGDHD